MNYQHFILTRFNMREQSALIPSDEWHEHRFSLFDTYCYPSVKSQTEQDFKWLVFFDILTPEKFLPRIKRYQEYANFIPIFSDDLSKYKSAIKEHLEERVSYLITTCLDNDDALSCNHIEMIQQQFASQEFIFVNVSQGLIVCNDRIYRNVDKSNAFVSAIEKVIDIAPNEFKTCWCVNHDKASSMGQILQIEHHDGWLQVVHGKNVRNRIKGVRTSSEGLCNFKINLTLKDNYNLEYYIDLIFLSPIRILREYLIRKMKSILGQENTTKLRIALRIK